MGTFQYSTESNCDSRSVTINWVTWPIPKNYKQFNKITKSCKIWNFSTKFFKFSKKSIIQCYTNGMCYSTDLTYVRGITNILINVFSKV